MNYRKTVCLSVLGLCSSLAAVVPTFAQQTASKKNGVPKTVDTARSTLPRDTSVRIGTLSNGFTYYIRANTKPERQAKLMLVVKAGSLQEDDDQIGMAHFVEHMAFNGTKRFKENQLIAYLESIGVRFGTDLNAFTTWDKTVYELEVPTTKHEQLATAFDILSDWAGEITFDSLDVVAERGVIVEEWRGRQSPSAQVQHQHEQVMFNGARYLKRNPIGTVESIQSTNPAPLKRFYRDWYRPNLMAVVAVGDFVPADIERMIVERFAHLKNPVPERALESYAIPGNVEPLFSIVRDSMANGTSLGITYKVPEAQGDPRTMMRQSLAFSIFTSALNRRLGQLTRSAYPPFVSAQVGVGTVAPSQPAFTITVGTHADAPAASLEAVLAEVERIARFGLDTAELGRLRTDMLEATERGFSERHKALSTGYAQTYSTHFVQGGDLVDPAAEIAMYREAMASVDNEEIRQMAGIWRVKENRVFVLTAPSALHVRVPEPSSLLGVFDDVEAMRLEPYHDVAIRDEPLMPTLPVRGKIESRQLHAHGIQEWRLSNGIRIFLRPSQSTTDMVAMFGRSTGGFYRNLDSIGYVPASTATRILSLSGAGSFTAQEIEKKMAGRGVAQAGTSIGPFEETATTVSRLTDFETALQLLNLNILYPRLDTAAIETYKIQTATAFKNRIRTVEDDYRDTVRLTMSQNHPLVREEISAQIDQLDPEKSLQVFKDRFADMSDFRFIIVGNFNPDSIAPLIEQYIASLPGHGRVEAIHDPGITPPAGLIRKTVKGAKTQRTSTSLSFFGSVEDDRYSAWYLTALQSVIQSRLTDRLREKLGGVYSPSVSSNTHRYPKLAYSLDIGFISAPERAEELVQATLDVLRELQTTLVSDAEVQKIREAGTRGYEASLNDDMSWATRIELFDHLKLPFGEMTDYTVLKNLTPADIQAAARKYINLKRYAHFDLVPGPAVGVDQ